jgi:hypothetical protein
MTESQCFFGRFSWRDNIDAPAVLFPENLAIAEGRVEQGVKQPSASIDYSNSISPTTILTGRVGLSRSEFTYDNQGLGFKPSSLGLPADMDRVVDRQMFPRIGPSGYVSLGGSDHRHSSFNTYTALANMTKIAGNHFLKFGWEGRIIRVNVWEARAPGTFNFSGSFTQGPDPNRASSTAGNSLASLLLGTGTSGNTLIHAWQNTLKRRFSGGLQFEGSYTWARLLDTGISHQNTYDVAASRALSSSDTAHRLVMAFVYDLPFGRGPRFGGGASGLPQALFGGWRVNGITAHQTGTPIRISGSNTAGIFSPTMLANNNGRRGKKTGRAQDRLSAYFDTSVFSQPPPFTFGNQPAYSPDIRTHSIHNWDLSLFKEFNITEKIVTQFRAEFFNAFNTPRFGSPNTSVTSSSFGVITSQSSNPRQTQFGLKFLW